jgi:hypothetical protein
MASLWYPVLCTRSSPPTSGLPLEQRMTQLREHLGLSPDDLNIDLGPLGQLLSHD